MSSQMSTLRRAFALRWGVLRLVLALGLCAVLLADTASRTWRLALAALPDADVAGEVRGLMAQERYAEAAMLAETVIGWSSEFEQSGLATSRLAELSTLAASAKAEQSSILRRIKDVGWGALSGQGDSMEALIGAVGSDMLIFGDVRDLAIQSARLVLDGKADPVIAALSAVGLATTLTPEIDWAPAVLKLARRAGTLSKPLTESILALARGGIAPLRPALASVSTLARKLTPAGAIAAMAPAKNADDLAALAAFTTRIKAPGAAHAALHLTGRAGAEAVMRAGPRADDLLLAAAKKGRAGGKLLQSPLARAAMRPHFLVGALKGLYKGNISKLLQHGLDWSAPFAHWLIGISAAAAVVQTWALRRRWLASGRPLALQSGS